MITRVLAHCTVSDLARARDWYGGLFERTPDAEPMPGLIEWHIGDSAGLQVWSEPDRAGASSVVFGDTDIDAVTPMWDRYSMWIGDTLRSTECDRSSGAPVEGSMTGSSATGE